MRISYPFFFHPQLIQTEIRFEAKNRRLIKRIKQIKRIKRIKKVDGSIERETRGNFRGGKKDKRNFFLA